MFKENLISLGLIAVGLLTAIGLSLVLPEEKLLLTLPLPTSLIGAGLTKWSNNKD